RSIEERPGVIPCKGAPRAVSAFEARGEPCDEQPRILVTEICNRRVVPVGMRLSGLQPEFDETRAKRAISSRLRLRGRCRREYSSRHGAVMLWCRGGNMAPVSLNEKRAKCPRSLRNHHCVAHM